MVRQVVRPTTTPTPTAKIVTAKTIDYNCEEHPEFISDRKPFPFESPQHYINRHAGAVKTQIEEICGV